MARNPSCFSFILASSCFALALKYGKRDIQLLSRLHFSISTVFYDKLIQLMAWRGKSFSRCWLHIEPQYLKTITQKIEIGRNGRTIKLCSQSKASNSKSFFVFIFKNWKRILQSNQWIDWFVQTNLCFTSQAFQVAH